MSILLSTLKNRNRLQNLAFTIGIVGSRKHSATEGQAWADLAPHLTVYGFDADEEACEVSNAWVAQTAIPWVEHHFPLVLSDTAQEKSLYITNLVHCSSLYAPHESYLNRFLGMKEGIQLDCELTVETTTLDDFCEAENIPGIDFLKIDVQGADLDVLRGASRLLERSVLGVMIEVEFTPLYQNQPLFSEIDAFLRSQGFMLMDLIMEDSWCRRPRSISPLQSAQNNGQLLWADALYIRDPLIETHHPISQLPEHILKLVCLMDVLGYPDYALELMAHLTTHYGQGDPESPYNLAADIVAVLSSFPELVEQGLDSLKIIQDISSFL